MQEEIKELLKAFQVPSFYPHAVDKIEFIETHISWVFLTGLYVYKIKKPVDMGFLDFSTLDKRQYYCEQEVYLNKRLAPKYYLEVLPITGSFTHPVIAGSGPTIEYVVKMKQFPQQAQLDRLLDAGQLSNQHMRLLAETIADFHQTINKADETGSFGSLEHIYQPVENCYQNILQRTDDSDEISRIITLQAWTKTTLTSFEKAFLSRKKNGFIRECHGDLHLRNIAIDGDEVIAFDGIEFSDELRWNDVISEIAFLVMDLDDRNQPGLANVFLNRYLELTGDYQGIELLPYYLVYRAIVRAMVSCIRLSQENVSKEEYSKEKQSFLCYLALAELYTTQHQPAIIITHGLSGSGKTFVTQQLMEQTRYIRIRSDVERKRMLGILETQRTKKSIADGIYNQSTSLDTYKELARLTNLIINSGYTVVVDAAFLKQAMRKIFFDLSIKLNIPFLIVDCLAPQEVMKSRILSRQEIDKDASDADLSVLQYQLTQNDDFTNEEQPNVLSVYSSNANDLRRLLLRINRLSD